MVISKSTFNSTNLFLFSHHYIPTNNIVPFSAPKKNPHTTHNSSNRSDEGLTLETPAFKLFTVSIYVFNSVVNTKLPVILAHRRSTTISLETYPLYSFVYNSAYYI